MVEHLNIQCVTSGAKHSDYRTTVHSQLGLITRFIFTQHNRRHRHGIGIGIGIGIGVYIGIGILIIIIILIGIIINMGQSV